MTLKADTSWVSVHGGHSGQFCCHAADSLELVIEEYIRREFAWVGITEHMPPSDERFIYPDEKAAGLDLEAMHNRFGRYIETGRELQQKYASRITIYLGFETEGYAGAVDAVRKLRSQYAPDYILGSVHHVNGIAFDMGPDQYDEALWTAGSYEALYLNYFDRQYELLCALVPEVVGHFDLIRIFDPDYATHLRVPIVWERICRNLEFVQANGLILDFNLRALSKGGKEPYVAAPILKQAISMGIRLAPGDDSHGVADIGKHMAEGIQILRAFGADTRWTRPTDVKPPQRR